jgi:hypothetical protein
MGLSIQKRKTFPRLSEIDLSDTLCDIFSVNAVRTAFMLSRFGNASQAAGVPRARAQKTER